MSERRDARYVVLGGGASGSAIVRALAARGVAGPVLLVDDGSVPLDDRVWASWRPLSEPEDPAVSASWRRLLVATERGERELALVRHRYVAVRGRDLRAATDTALAAIGGARLTARALAVREDARGAVVSTDVGDVRADLVLDSVGLHPDVTSAPHAWMSFTGWEVECDHPAFTPDRLRLMDFRVPQDDGVSFVYTLPWSATTALVELTGFCAAASPQSTETSLSAYLDGSLGAGRYAVTRREAATVPLRPHVHRHSAAHHVALGESAGLVKASSGYGFELARRDAAHIAADLRAGRRPTGLVRSARHQAMDAVFLDLALRRPATLVAALEQLFARNPADLALAFLDERTTLREEVRLVSSLPVRPFVAAAAHAAARSCACGRACPAVAASPRRVSGAVARSRRHGGG